MCFHIKGLWEMALWRVLAMKTQGPILGHVGGDKAIPCCVAIFGRKPKVYRCIVLWNLRAYATVLVLGMQVSMSKLTCGLGYGSVVERALAGRGRVESRYL